MEIMILSLFLSFCHTQGALLLSEVLRERDAQLEYKKKKEGRLREIDEKYLQIQKEVGKRPHVYVFGPILKLVEGRQSWLRENNLQWLSHTHSNLDAYRFENF